MIPHLPEIGQTIDGIEQMVTLGMDPPITHRERQLTRAITSAIIGYVNAAIRGDTWHTSLPSPSSSPAAPSSGPRS